MSSRRLAVSIGYLTGTRLVFNTAWRFVYPFLPAISRGLGVSLERAGLLVSARSIAGMATPLVVATVGRGERRRRIVTVTLALFVVGASVTAATGAFTGALVGFVLIGLAKPSFDVAAHAYIADRVPYRRRARALSILELTWAGGLLVGAPVTGWMIDRLDWRAPFWAFAALGIVAVLLLRPALDPDTGGDGTAAEPFRLTRPAAALLASVFFFNLGAETTIVVFGAWLEEHTRTRRAPCLLRNDRLLLQRETLLVKSLEHQIGCHEFGKGCGFDALVSIFLCQNGAALQIDQQESARVQARRRAMVVEDLGLRRQASGENQDQGAKRHVLRPGLYPPCTLRSIVSSAVA